VLGASTSRIYVRDGVAQQVPNFSGTEPAKLKAPAAPIGFPATLAESPLTLDAIEQAGGNARGVAIINPTISMPTSKRCTMAACAGPNCRLDASDQKFLKSELLFESTRSQSQRRCRAPTLGNARHSGTAQSGACSPLFLFNPKRGIAMHSENQVRRVAKQIGYRAIKSRWRRNTTDNRGQFRFLISGQILSSAESVSISADDVVEVCSSAAGAGSGRWGEPHLISRLEFIFSQLPSRCCWRKIQLHHQRISKRTPPTTVFARISRIWKLSAVVCRVTTPT